MLEKLSLILMVVGYALIALATISGIGYGLYNWGSVGLELGASAWLGFVLFAKMFGGGLVSLLFGIAVASL